MHPASTRGNLSFCSVRVGDVFKGRQDRLREGQKVRLYKALASVGRSSFVIVWFSCLVREASDHLCSFCRAQNEPAVVIDGFAGGKGVAIVVIVVTD